MKRVPVNLISGPLGIGKTTAIRHLLEHRPAGERWAVLVNEFGLVGLDAALLADSATQEGVEVREVAGGCICCSAGLLFEVALALLLEQRPDRLLIEPTGLAALSGVLDALDREHVRDRVDVRSTICLLDPATVNADRQREEVADQIEAADILLANRCDAATAGQLDAFSEWAQTLFPRKRHVGRIERGQLATEWLDLVADRSVAAPRGRFRHGTDHQHQQTDVGSERGGSPVDAATDCSPSQPIVCCHHRSPVLSTLGWVCWKGLVFELERAVRLLAELSRLPGVQRLKAVLRTDDGWWSFNFTPETREAQPTAYRRDSRIEVILQGDAGTNLEVWDEALRLSFVPDQEVH